MRWIKEAATDGESGVTSSTRIALLISSTTLSLSTLVLTTAVLWQPELVPALSVVAGGLAGMSGMSYTAQRFGRSRRPRIDDPDDHH